jgi:hypothetical protein
MTKEEKRKIEQEILKYKSNYDNCVEFIWKGDNVEFGGSLDTHNNAELPNLTSIGGSLYIRSNAEFSAPQLKTVGGSIEIYSNVELSQLKTVGGYLDIYSNAEFSAPQLTNKNFARNMKDGDERHGFIKADNMIIQFTSKRIRTIGGIKYLVYKTPFIKIKYVINKTGSENWSHCSNMKSGILDIRFKEAKRDIEQYKDYSLKDKISYEDAVILYRVITGACQQGTQQFIDNNKEIAKKTEFTIQEIIDLTQGQYGNESLQDFFKEME